MIHPQALDITEKLRATYPDDFIVANLFINIGEVANLTPQVESGLEKVTFSFKETGKSKTMKSEEVLAVENTSQADELLIQIISTLVRT